MKYITQDPIIALLAVVAIYYICKMVVDVAKVIVNKNSNVDKD